MIKKNKKVKFIACEVIYDKVKNKIPHNWSVTYFEKRLHRQSDTLRKRLQDVIDESQHYDAIVLGYGLCGKGTERLVSRNTILVIPRCQDCIAILLGSVEEYKKQFSKEPGTYYLTRGYIGDVDDSITSGFSEAKKKYDRETWDWIISKLLKNYKRLAFINTGNYNPEKWLKKAKKGARKLKLKFEEINGTNEFFSKMLKGNWTAIF